MTHTKLIDLTFPEVAKLIHDQRYMVDEQKAVQAQMDQKDQADLERFIVSLNPVLA